MNLPNGDYDICPVCFWEDDPVAYDDPNEVACCNGVSLVQATENYLAFGACRRDMIKNVRQPKKEEIPNTI